MTYRARVPTSTSQETLVEYSSMMTVERSK